MAQEQTHKDRQPRTQNPPGESIPQTGSAQLRWIVFDAVGTLIEPVPSAADVYFDVARQYGSQLSREEIGRRFRKVFRESERGDLDGPAELQFATSEAIERGRWQTIVTQVIDDIPDGSACFESLFDHFARPASWKCFDEVPATLNRLTRLGFRLALASNFDGRLHRVCNDLSALSGITLRVISAEVGYRKPSRRFFDALIEATGCRPSELLMVGDDRENDAEGAREAGIAALLVRRGDHAEDGAIADLSELLPWLAARGIIRPSNLLHVSPGPV